MELNALETTGETFLHVRHEPDGTVVALTEPGGDATPEPAGVITESMVGGQAACSDLTWGDNGRKESDNHQWRYNRSTHPSPGSTAATYHEQAIINGVNNLLSGRNSCSLQRNFRAYHSYNGSTTLRANISNAATCATEDSSNVVNWGILDGSTTLAVACTWAWILPGRDEISTADIKVDTGWSWLTAGPSSTCSGRFDLEAVMTHEWGHAYGLGHTPDPIAEHRQQTMSPVITACSTFQRTLGRGDWAGMYNVYGLA